MEHLSKLLNSETKKSDKAVKHNLQGQMCFTFFELATMTEYQSFHQSQLSLVSHL